jgi:hypothetical protein
MNNQMGNTGQGEPLVEFEVYIRGVLSLVVFGYIFPLISLSDIVSFNRLTLILQIICQSAIKHMITSQIKTITLVLNVATF